MNIGERIRESRKRAGYSLSILSDRTGIGQSSLSEFENGKREPSLSQVTAIAQACRRPLVALLTDVEDPEELVLWRERPANAEEIEAQFKELAHNYRLLEAWCGEVRESYLPNPGENFGRFTHGDAAELAGRVRRELDLGGRPALELARILEEDCGVKIFHCPLEPTGTAACTRSDRSGYAIMLNATSPRTRRNYDLAHELFHLITWGLFRNVSLNATAEEEKLANTFASYLLMPDDALRSVLSRFRQLATSDIPDVARQFDVSIEAAVWRLHYFYNWGKENSERTKDYARMAAIFAAAAPPESAPAKLPDRYKALATKALSRGLISIGRYADLLEISRWEAMKHAQQEDATDAPIPVAAA